MLEVLQRGLLTIRNCSLFRRANVTIRPTIVSIGSTNEPTCLTIYKIPSNARCIRSKSMSPTLYAAYIETYEIRRDYSPRYVFVSHQRGIMHKRIKKQKKHLSRKLRVVLFAGDSLVGTTIENHSNDEDTHQRRQTLCQSVYRFGRIKLSATAGLRNGPRAYGSLDKL